MVSLWIYAGWTQVWLHTFFDWLLPLWTYPAFSKCNYKYSDNNEHMFLCNADFGNCFWFIMIVAGLERVSQPVMHDNFLCSRFFQFCENQTCCLAPSSRKRLIIFISFFLWSFVWVPTKISIGSRNINRRSACDTPGHFQFKHALHLVSVWCEVNSIALEWS